MKSIKILVTVVVVVGCSTLATAQPSSDQIRTCTRDICSQMRSCTTGVGDVLSVQKSGLHSQNGSSDCRQELLDVYSSCVEGEGLERVAKPNDSSSTTGSKKNNKVTAPKAATLQTVATPKRK